MPSPAQARSCGEHFPGNWFSSTPNWPAVLQVPSAIRVAEWNGTRRRTTALQRILIARPALHGPAASCEIGHEQSSLNA
jgi:hypothetical protein